MYDINLPPLSRTAPAPPKKIDLDGYLRRRVAPALVESEVLVGIGNDKDYLKVLKESEECQKCLKALEGNENLFDADAEHTFKEWLAIELDEEP